MGTGKKWTRDELYIVLNLYHKLTFGQFDEDNPAVASLASKLQRTPGSIAMKLGNLAKFDPALQLRGIKGLPGASKLDELIWNEFHADLAETVPISETALRKLYKVPENGDLEVIPKEGIRVRKRPPTGPTETIANVKVRRGQEFFRDAVLNNFGGRCGVSGLEVRDLLIASHILPWGTHLEERLNVRNGLCLSRLHDAAFDRGLITFDAKFRLVLSPQLKTSLPQRAIAENFGAYEGETLMLPADAVIPEASFLAKHRSKVFQKS